MFSVSAVFWGLVLAGSYILLGVGVFGVFRTLWVALATLELKPTARVLAVTAGCLVVGYLFRQQVNDLPPATHSDAGLLSMFWIAFMLVVAFFTWGNNGNRPTQPKP
ncbi:hypothetical protein N0497_28685 [Pseudomonas aeruginosa]|nr:hypothetical protein [Pseudomonas aeruginosa]